MAAIPTSSLPAVGSVLSTDTITLSRDGINLLRATIAQLFASPAFSGNPTAPTQAAGNSSTRIASTAFVQAALLNLGLTTDDIEDLTGIAGSPDNLTNALVALNANKQPLDTLLTNIAALTFGADSYIYGTGPDAVAVGTVTAAARTLLAQATQLDIRNTGAGFVDAILDKASPGNIGQTTPGLVRVSAGSAAAPSLSVNDAGTGLYSVGTDQPALAISGVARWLYSSSGLMGHAGGSVAAFTPAQVLDLRSSSNVRMYLDGATADFQGTRNSADNSGATFVGRKARGIPGTPAVIIQNDRPLLFQALSYDGSAFRETGLFTCSAIEPTPSSTAMGGNWVWSATAVGTLTRTEFLRGEAGGIAVKTGVSPTAKLHIGAGSATANTAPLQINNGTLETTARANVIENNNDLHFTRAGNIRLSIGGALEMDNFASVGNVGTGVDTLYSETLLGGTLDTNGAAYRFSGGGITTADAVDTRRIILTLGGVTVFDSTALTTASAAEWSFWVVFERDSSSSVRAFGQFSITGVIPVPIAKLIAGVTLSSNQTILLTGESAGATVSDNDVVAYASKGDYLPHGVL